MHLVFVTNQHAKLYQMPWKYQEQLHELFQKHQEIDGCVQLQQ